MEKRRKERRREGRGREEERKEKKELIDNLVSFKVLRGNLYSCKKDGMKYDRYLEN